MSCSLTRSGTEEAGRCGRRRSSRKRSCETATISPLTVAAATERKVASKATKQQACSAFVRDESSDDSSSSDDSDAAPTAAPVVLRGPNRHPLELPARRSLADFYIDPASGERMDRPTRKVDETTKALKEAVLARYNKVRIAAQHRSTDQCT